MAYPLAWRVSAGVEEHVAANPVRRDARRRHPRDRGRACTGVSLLGCSLTSTSSVALTLGLDRRAERPHLPVEFFVVERRDVRAHVRVRVNGDLGHRDRLPRLAVRPVKQTLSDADRHAWLSTTAAGDAGLRRPRYVSMP